MSVDGRAAAAGANLELNDAAVLHSTGVGVMLRLTSSLMLASNILLGYCRNILLLVPKILQFWKLRWFLMDSKGSRYPDAKVCH